MLTLYIELLTGYLFQVTVILYVFLDATLEHFGSKFIEQAFGKHHQTYLAISMVNLLQTDGLDCLVGGFNPSEKY